MLSTYTYNSRNETLCYTKSCNRLHSYARFTVNRTSIKSPTDVHKLGHYTCHALYITHDMLPADLKGNAIDGIFAWSVKNSREGRTYILWFLRDMSTSWSNWIAVFNNRQATLMQLATHLKYRSVAFLIVVRSFRLRGKGAERFYFRETTRDV